MLVDERLFRLPRSSLEKFQSLLNFAHAIHKREFVTFLNTTRFPTFALFLATWKVKN